MTVRISSPMAGTIRPGMACLPTIEVDCTYSSKAKSLVQALNFSGPSRAQSGEPVLNRMRITPVGTDKLQQTWEKSVNNGNTWTQEFSLDYSRRSR